jgi:inorganic pyrophosphatase
MVDVEPGKKTAETFFDRHAGAVRMRALLPLLAVAVVAACADAPERSSANAASYPPAPAGLDLKRSAYLEAATRHEHHVWRDLDPVNDDGTVNGYVEIPSGESTKWEFSIPLNRREVDRYIPKALGGYPVNYGFLPGTISYDGDPADVVFLGPPLDGGAVVRGRIVAVMHMIDDGDLDSKVVASPIDAGGGTTHRLDPEGRERLERFFNSYKNHEGKVTRITGWGDEADARTFIGATSRFFNTGGA